jgi:hypothetical protein
VGGTLDRGGGEGGRHRGGVQWQVEHHRSRQGYPERFAVANFAVPCTHSPFLWKME